MARKKIKTEERMASSYGPVPLNESHTLFFNGNQTSTNIRVDNYSASCNIVFRRCVELISSQMGLLDCRLVEYGKDGSKKPICDAPEFQLVQHQSNNYLSAMSFKSLIQSWASSWG